MKKQVIVLAGGDGKRFGSVVPKQFLRLTGKPVFLHSIDQFFYYDPTIKIIVVLAEPYIGFAEKILKKSSKNYNTIITHGGNKRFDSVKNGLSIAEDNGIIAIHDAARPVVNLALISRAFNIASKHGSAIPAIPIIDSIRMVTNDQNHVINRENLFRIQTPQCFRTVLIKKAYLSDFSDTFTDDATVFETLGIPVHLFPGDMNNIKLTSLTDLLIARTLLKIKKSDK